MEKQNEENKNVVPLSKGQQELIQRLGNLGNKEGLPPSCALISALTMVSDKLELTFDEIRATLNLSKSATSNAINFLLERDSLEYVTKLGDRKRYFRSNLETWKDVYSIHFTKIAKLNKLMHEIRAVRTPKTVEFNKALDGLTSFMDYLLGKIPKIFEEWKENNQDEQAGK